MLSRAFSTILLLVGGAASAAAQSSSVTDYKQGTIGFQRSGTQQFIGAQNATSKAMSSLGYIDTTTGEFVSTGRVPLRAPGDVADYPASTRFTDRMLGSLANKLPGTPSIQSIAASLKDVAEFYSYGGKATGCGLCATNPLSSVTSVNGTNTTGYTLAQWQSFYSVCNDSKGRNPVTALTNEVDEIAIQCVINKKTQDGTLWLPSGLLYQTKPIISGQFALVVRGVGGRDATTLVQTVRGQDGWHHGTADTGWVDGNGVPNYLSRFAMHGITFGCGGPGGFGTEFVCGTALKADFNIGSAGFTLQDVAVTGRGNQTTNYWHDGINCNNCSLTEITRGSIGGINTGAGIGSLLSTGTGMAFTGKGAVQFSIRDTTTNGWNKAVTMTTGNKDASTTFGNQEGFVFDNWQANQVMDALTTINFPGDGNISPQFVITNSQFNVCRRLFYIAASSEIFITNNLIYGCTSGVQTGGTAGYTQYVGPVTGSGSSGAPTVTLTAPAPAGLTAGVPFFGPGVPSNTTVASVSGATVTLSNALTATGSGAQYIYGKGSPGFDAVEYNIFNNTQRLVMRDNVLALGSAANIATFGRLLFTSDALLQNNRVQAVFNYSLNTGWFNDTGNARVVERDSGFVGVPSWFTPVAGALNDVANGVRFGSFYAQFGTTLRSDNSLGYSNTQVVTIDANKNATLYVPPTFTAVPTSIQVTNGDMGANQAFCGVARANTSLSGIGITCPAAAAGAPIRIDYTLTGPR